jgi:DNA invertase Pin-like site-specific DNA recombinase
MRDPQNPDFCVSKHCSESIIPLSSCQYVWGTQLMLIGYARVSTIDQNPELQTEALSAAGCERIFTEKASGSHKDRPQLKAALDYMRAGDTLIVWKLSRLARSLKQINVHLWWQLLAGCRHWLIRKSDYILSASVSRRRCWQAHCH